MKPKTAELLNFLLWSSDHFVRPTFRNLTDSYEAWAYRNGLLRQMAELEKKQLVERDQRGSDERIYRLSEHGRVLAMVARLGRKVAPCHFRRAFRTKRSARAASPLSPKQGLWLLAEQRLGHPGP